MKIITNEMAWTLDQQIKRARDRFETALQERYRHFTMPPAPVSDSLISEQYEAALSSRIHWHHQWYAYGQSLAEQLRAHTFDDYDAAYRDGKRPRQPWRRIP